MAHEGHSNYSLLTLTNYSTYQPKGTPSDTQGANEGQTKGNNIRMKEQQEKKEIKKEDISDSSSPPPKPKKEKKAREVVNGEAYRGKHPTFDNFLDYCLKRSIAPNIHIKKYFEIRNEFTTKVSFWEETKGCIDWLYDKGLKSINSQRLRNRMLNSIKFAKEKETKKQQEYRDKKDQKIAKPSTTKPLIPLWKPPL